MMSKISRLIFLSLLFTLIFGLFSVKIKDPDFWWHLKTGEYIYQTHSLPATDPFSYTSALSKSGDLESESIEFKLTQYWLAQLIFYLIYHFFSFQGIVFLRASLLTVLVFLIYRAVRKEGFGPFFSIMLLLIAAVMLYDFQDVRPQLFSFLLAFSLFYLLEGFRKNSYESPHNLQSPSSGHCDPPKAERSDAAIPSEKTRLLRSTRNDNKLYLLPIPVIMLLWANLHGGFILGAIILLVYFFSETTKYLIKKLGPPLPYRSLKSLAIVTAISILSSLINPNGYNVIPLLLAHGSSFESGQIIEWMSPLMQFKTGFINPGLIMYFLLLALAVLLFLINIRRLDITDALLFSILAAISLSARRFIPLFVPVAILMVARYGAKTIELLPHKEHFKVTRKSLSALPYVFLSVLLVTIMIKTNIIEGLIPDAASHGIAPNEYPVDAVTFLKKNRISGNMFNPYAWGGYLVWALYPEYKVFIDGRGLTERSLSEEINIMTANSQNFDGIPLWKALLNSYRVNLIVTFSVDRYSGRLVPLIPVLLKDPEWALIYMDNISLIFARMSNQNSEILKEFSLPKQWLWNEVITEVIARSKSAWNKAVRSNLYVTAGDAFLEKRSFRQAEEAYLHAQKINPENSMVNRRLNLLKAYGY